MRAWVTDHEDVRQAPETLKEKSQPYLVKLMEDGVLAMPAGATVMRFLPPLTIGFDELEFVAEKVASVLPAV